MSNIDRILWPIGWTLLTPVIIGILWTLCISLLPLPSLGWGLLATLFILCVVSTVPVWILRSSRNANHTAGAVLATIALVIGILVTFAVVSFSMYLTAEGVTELVDTPMVQIQP